MKIRNQLFLGFLLIIPLILILGAITFVNLDNIVKHYEFLVKHDLEVLQNAQKLQKFVVDAETGQRGFVITHDEQFLDPYHNGVNEFYSLMKIEKSLVSDYPSQVQRLEKIEQLFEKWNKEAAIPEINLSRESIDNPENREKVILLIQQKTGKNLLDEMRNEFENFIAIQNELKDERLLETQLIISNTRMIIFTFVIISAIIAIAIALKISNIIYAPIKSLESAMKDVEKGNLFQNIPIKGTDELKSLTNSFLSMLKQIQKITNLEKQLIISKENEKASKMIAIGNLASRLAHDIRNPLTVIKGTLDVIKAKNSSLSEEDIDRFDRVDYSIYRISHQVDNVLDFIRGKPMDFSNHSFQKLVESAINDIEKDDQISIEVKNCNIELKCDHESMKVVMINLIFNAVQALDGQGTIKIKTESKDDQISIQIQDDGPGIPEDKIDEIFEPLFTTKQEGTGLGLASCKSIIEQHGGTISVQNNPTRFTINLPKKI